MASFFEHPCGTVSTIAHIVQCVSAVIVIGITAWAVRDTNTLPVIFSLVIAVITPVLYGVTLTTSCVSNRRRWHVLPMILTDAVLSYLWLTSFILLALNYNHISCSINRWNGERVCSRKFATEAFSFIAFFTSLGALAIEVLYLYIPKNDTSMQERKNGHQQLEQNLQSAGVVA